MNVSKYKRYLHLQSFEKIPIPWGEVFGNHRKITVEIGFGSGEYLCALAQMFPDKNFVGFETSLTSIEKTLRRLEDLALSNVRVARADGRFVLRELFDDNSVERVVVNFPCPWPKKRHSKRRLTREDFAETLAAVLEQEGVFELATDVEWFAREMIDTLNETLSFSLVEFTVNPDRLLKTRYERKWLAQGREIYLLRAKKIRNFTIERTVTGELPHAKLKRVNTDKLFKIKGQIWQEDDKVVVIKDVYQNLDLDNWLVLTYSSDGDFQQHYYILITRKDDGFLVKLDSTTVPFRTPAVKWSVYRIAEEISV